MKAVCFSVALMWASLGYGQYLPQAPMVPVQQPVQVNQQVVQQGGPMPAPMPPMQPGYVPPGLPIQEWRDGMRESFVHSDTHEVRPIREWEQYPQYQQQYQYQQPYYQQQYQYQQPYYPNTCYQRSYCQPQCQQYYYPQCQQQYYRPCWQSWLGW